MLRTQQIIGIEVIFEQYCVNTGGEKEGEQPGKGALS